MQPFTSLKTTKNNSNKQMYYVHRINNSPTIFFIKIYQVAVGTSGTFLRQDSQIYWFPDQNYVWLSHLLLNGITVVGGRWVSRFPVLIQRHVNQSNSDDKGWGAGGQQQSLFRLPYVELGTTVVPKSVRSPRFRQIEFHDRFRSQAVPLLWSYRNGETGAFQLRPELAVKTEIPADD